MAEAVVIRPVLRTDAEDWRSLWAGYNAFYGRAGETALAPEITAMTWERIFDGYEPVHALVAARGAALVGLAHYLFHRSTIAIAPNCYLQDLYTSPAARGAGIGQALIEAVFLRAREAGAGRIYWQTRKDNATARRLYDRLAEESGFVVYRQVL